MEVIGAGSHILKTLVDILRFFQIDFDLRLFVTSFLLEENTAFSY